MKIVIVNSDVKYGGKRYREGSEYDVPKDLPEEALDAMEGFWEQIPEKEKPAKPKNKKSKNAGTKRKGAGAGDGSDRKPPEGGEKEDS